MMKKFLMALLVLAGALGAQADGDWRTTLGKVWNLGGDTGIAGFLQKEAPAYLTGNFAEADRIRDEITARGFVLEDTPQGAKVRRA